MPSSLDAMRYAGVGLHLAATIGVFAAVGYWADGRLGTLPLFLLLGVFLGFGLGLRSLIARVGPTESKRDTHPPANPPE